MMLFTSSHNPPGATSPQSFVDHGNNTDSPKKLSDLLIYPIQHFYNSNWALLTSHIGFHMSASSRVKIISSANTFFGLKFTSTGSYIRPTPRIGITFERLNLDKTEKVQNYGFSKIAHGRNTVFTGLVTADNIKGIMALNPNLDTYVPYGTSTLSGYIAYVVTAQLLDLAARSIPYPSITSDDTLVPQGGGFLPDTESETELKSPVPNKFSNKANEAKISLADEDVDLKKSRLLDGSPYIASPVDLNKRRSFFADPKELKTPGLFLPYFQGLIVDDKTTTVNIILRHFIPCLGNDQDEARKAADGLKTGWKTLSHTQTGMELTHMAYCIDLALRAGARPIFYIRSNGSYLGTVLLGESFTIVKEGKGYTPITVEELQTQLSEYDSHDDAIHKIVELIKSVDSTITLTPSEIISPRQIHNIFRKLTIPTATADELRRQLKRTSFIVTPYDSRKASHLHFLITAIRDEIFMSDASPMNANSPFIFSKSIVESSLASFGSYAPSFIERTGIAIAFGNATETPLMKKKEEGKLVLPHGLPIFIKPVQEAALDWNVTSKQAIIRIRTNNAGNYVNASKVFTNKEAQTMCGLLQNAFGPLTAARKDAGEVKKRKRDEMDRKASGTQKKVKRGLDTGLFPFTFDDLRDQATAITDPESMQVDANADESPAEGLFDI